MKQDKYNEDDLDSVDKIEITPPKMRMVKPKITKKLMLQELYDVILDYNTGVEGVKAAEKISAIKQICVMEGFNLPTVTEVRNKTITLQF